MAATVPPLRRSIRGPSPLRVKCHRPGERSTLPKLGFSFLRGSRRAGPARCRTNPRAPLILCRCANHLWGRGSSRSRGMPEGAHPASCEVGFRTETAGFARCYKGFGLCDSHSPSSRGRGLPQTRGDLARWRTVGAGSVRETSRGSLGSAYELPVSKSIAVPAGGPVRVCSFAWNEQRRATAVPSLGRVGCPGRCSYGRRPGSAGLWLMLVGGECARVRASGDSVGIAVP